MAMLLARAAALSVRGGSAAATAAVPSASVAAAAVARGARDMLSSGDDEGMRGRRQQRRGYTYTPDSSVVHLTFVDFEGNRLTVPAHAGKDTVLDVAKMHQVDLEASCCGGGDPVEIKRSHEFTEPNYGSGPSCMNCVVQVPRKFKAMVNPLPDYVVEEMQWFWEDELPDTATLACQMKVTKEMDGMNVYIPDHPPANNY